MPSNVAVPVSEIGHDTLPGAVPTALAVQFTVVPDSVPRAVPADLELPAQVALNVPEPVVPVNSVIDQ